MNGFSGAIIKCFDHFNTPTLAEDGPDIVIIPIGSNDITYNTVDKIDVKDIVNRIINIERKGLYYGVKDMIKLSIFSKNQFKLTRVMNQDKLRVTCCVTSAKEINSHSSVTTKLLEKIYGEMVHAWTMTVNMYLLVTLLTF